MEIYRVRKSWENIASQKGAFLVFEDAMRLAKKKKCNIYTADKICVWNYKKYKNKKHFWRDFLCLKSH